MGFFNLFQDGIVFLPSGLENDVVLIQADIRLVGRDDHHVQIVDVLEFVGLGFSCSGHSRQLLVEPEIVLQGNGGERLGFLFNLHPFLGLNSLVQTVRPAPPGHDPAGIFVDNHHLAFLHDIFHIALIQAVGAEQLSDDVNFLACLFES